MPTLANPVIHGTQTRRNGLHYVFTPKHHGADSLASQWLPSLTLEEEFNVFDVADSLELADEDGNLYGAMSLGENSLQPLGTYGQLIALFWVAPAGQPWHGHPAWPLNEEGPTKLRKQRHRPTRALINSMVQVGLVPSIMRKRLMAGK